MNSYVKQLGIFILAFSIILTVFTWTASLKKAKEDPCLTDAGQSVDFAATDGSTMIAHGPANKKLYICRLEFTAHVVAPPPNNRLAATVIEGTGPNCTLDRTAVIGGPRPDQGFFLSDQGGLMIVTEGLSSHNSIAATTKPGNDLCIAVSTGTITGKIVTAVAK